MTTSAWPDRSSGGGSGAGATVAAQREGSRGKGSRGKGSATRQLACVPVGSCRSIVALERVQHPAQEVLRARMGRPAEDVRGGALLHQHAAIEEEDAVGH